MGICYTVCMVVVALMYSLAAFLLKSISVLIVFINSAVPALISIVSLAMGTFDEWYQVIFWITTGAGASSVIVLIIGAIFSEPAYLIIVLSYAPWFLGIVPQTVLAGF